jgi:hypothetical protein
MKRKKGKRGCSPICFPFIWVTYDYYCLIYRLYNTKLHFGENKFLYLQIRLQKLWLRRTSSPSRLIYPQCHHLLSSIYNKRSTLQVSQMHEDMFNATILPYSILPVFFRFHHHYPLYGLYTVNLSHTSIETNERNWCPLPYLPSVGPVLYEKVH